MVALLADIPTITPPPSRRGPVRHPARPTQPDGAGAPRREHYPVRSPVGTGSRPSPAVLRRRRVVAIGLVVVVVLLTWIGLQAALGRIGGGPLATTGAPGGLQDAGARVWIVHPGDTLWSIAQAVDPHGDVRPLVDRLAAEVHGTDLYSGETIPIP